nr:hypothetical protein [Mycoplasmopsis bovis]
MWIDDKWIHKMSYTLGGQIIDLGSGQEQYYSLQVRSFMQEWRWSDKANIKSL